MKTYLGKVTFIFMLSIFAQRCLAYDFEVDGFQFNIVNLEEGTAQLVATNSDDNGDLKLPSTVNFGGREIKIISIGKEAFKNNKLTSLQLGEYIESLEYGAFSNCKNLTTAILSDNTISIKDEVFYNCSNLEEITFTAKNCSVGWRIFSYCNKLTKVNIPSIKDWCNYNFDYPIFLETNQEVTLYINNIPYNDIIIPIETSEIKPFTFAMLQTVNSIALSNSIKKIGKDCFAGTSISKIDIPASCDSIFEGAFEGLTLDELKIPNNVKYLGKLDGGYYAYGNLSINKFIIEKSSTPITFQNHISFMYETKISEFVWLRPIEGLLYFTNGNTPKSDSSIFYGMKSLKKVIIGSEIPKLDSRVFYNCPGLEILEIEDSENPIIFMQDNGFNKTTTGIYTRYTPIYYNEFNSSPLNSIYLGRNIIFERDSLESYLEANISEVRDFSPFNKQKKIEKVSIGDMVTELPCKELFSNCPLKYISIGINLGSIPDKTFFTEDETLTTVILNGLTPPIYESGFTNFAYVNAKLYVPTESFSLYRETEPWSKFWNIKELYEYEILPELIFINCEEVELSIGETFQLEATVLPEDTTNSTVIWVSSNEDVALISQEGLLTAVSEGITIITATCGEVYTSCKVTVINPVIEAEQIVLNVEKAELNIGQTLQLDATVLPEEVSDKTILWTTSNENVALVSEEGLVMAVSDGEAIITASCGEITADCLIIVLEDAGVESLMANPDLKISVYSVDGVLIKKNYKVEDIKSLTKGIYIIVCGKDRYKLSI